MVHAHTCRLEQVVFDVRDESQFNAGTNILKTASDCATNRVNCYRSMTPTRLTRVLQCFVMCIFLAFAIMFNQGDCFLLFVQPLLEPRPLAPSLRQTPSIW